MKKIILLLFSVIFAFAIEKTFLEPSEAFKQSFIKQENSLIIKLDLGKDIYLYADKLKVNISKPEKIDITQDINIPKPVPYDEYIVHFDNLSLEIPYSLLKSKVEASSYEIIFYFQGCSKAGLCYAPMKKSIQINVNNLESDIVSFDKETIKDISLSEVDTITNSLKSSSAILVLATFFGFGLLLSLTPCVFPMIPILSSIIVNAGQNKELTVKRGFFLSLVYVLAMSLAYAIAGVLAGLFGANLQVALQNPYVLVSFAAIFVALAFSMFGYFELRLPQALQNKINKTSESKEKQGVLGIAVMGFLSALIVGPCVAPPLAGALVYIGQTGDAFLGGAALFVMSLGMGLPLLLIGVGAGKFMPKPGGWMESITKIFGIVMLAIAIWMLDRVLNPNFVMFLWAFLFMGSAIYLKMYEHIVIKLITLSILVYGVVIFVGAISGATNVLKPLERFTSSGNSTIMMNNNKLAFIKVKNIDELEKAIKTSSKPVMLDFYADWCVSCKELEEITFKDEKVITKLKEFTLLKADVTKNTQEDKDLQKKFEIFGPPGLIFWDEKNQEIKAAKIIGYKNPKEFLEVVNKYF